MIRVVSATGYFKISGMKNKKPFDATPEQRRASSIVDDTDYYPAYFMTGLDALLDQIDLDQNRKLFNILLDEASHFFDFFEPCCQSGTLGCFVAQALKERGCTYRGVDISSHAITKARERAVFFWS